MFYSSGRRFLPSAEITGTNPHFSHWGCLLSPLVFVFSWWDDSTLWFTVQAFRSFKFFETVFLCRPRWPQTYHSPASVFAVLGLQVCAATLGLRASQVADLCFQLLSRNIFPRRPRCSALCRFIVELYTVVLTADLILFCVLSAIMPHFLWAQKGTSAAAFSHPIRPFCSSHLSLFKSGLLHFCSV